jgi:hypothetical protein
MRFYDLRHSCAGVLYEKGLGLKEIQKWLGYSDIKTASDIYMHISDLHTQTVAEGLETNVVLIFAELICNHSAIISPFLPRSFAAINNSLLSLDIGVIFPSPYENIIPYSIANL